MKSVKTWRDERLLGKPFVRRQEEIVLRIGNDGWTRQELVEKFKCGNFVAARILTKAAEELGVASATEMANRVSIEDLFAQTRVGVTTVYTWMCVLEGLKRNPLDWLDREPDELVTLTTEKAHVKSQQQQRLNSAKAPRRKRG